jgi:molecular chaperone DnaK
MALQRLKEAAEKAKCELSSMVQTTINLPFITADQSGPKHLQMNFSRAKFEGLVDDLVEKTKIPCQKALADAKLRTADVDEVILVGGSTRMPCVQAMVKEIFAKEPIKNLNPDEVVGLGAAVQAGVLSKEEGLEEIVLVDVTPLSLGVETMGGVMTRLIERNSHIPTEKSEIFTTPADNQTTVEIHVLQGEREFSRDNRSLGTFKLHGIPPAPRGMPQIEVTFKIDANGILNVFAKDKASGKEQSITIVASSGLSKDEVEKMKKEAEMNAGSDKKKRDLIEKQNMADSIAYQTEKTLKEYGDKISADQKSKIQATVDNLKKVKEKDDPAAIDRAIQEVQEASQEIGKALYQQAAAGSSQPGPGAQAGSSSGSAKSSGKKEGDDGKVIDADYEVKD